MTSFCMIGSLILGIGAWISAFAGIISRKQPCLFSAGSFALCALSLLLQLREIKYLAGIGDFSVIDDTIHAVVLAASVLVGVTVILNAAAIVRAKRRK